jgi:hypothetical protein
MFGAPNTSAIMSSVPPEHRGVASGMHLQNSGAAPSIAVFCSLVLAGLSISLPKTLTTGL